MRVFHNILVYFLLSITFRITTATTYFEYGSHAIGEVTSFSYKGTIPPIQYEYRLKVAHNNPDLHSDYTYLRVEWNDLFTKMKVLYNKEKRTLVFKIKSLPIIHVHIGVTGYSLPRNQQYKPKLDEETHWSEIVARGRKK